MNYKAGDTVICIDTTSIPGVENCKNLKRGARYTVQWHEGRCTSLVEFPHQSALLLMGFFSCPQCGSRGHTHCHFSAWRFIKLPPASMRDEEIATIDLMRTPPLGDDWQHKQKLVKA